MTPAEIISIGLNTASVVVSTFSLIVAFNLYSKFLNQKVNETQLSIVIALVSELNSIKFSVFDFEIEDDKIVSIPISNNSTKSFKELLEGKLIFKTFENGQPVFKKNNCRLVYPSPIRFKFSPLAQINNPLLPNSIAKELRHIIDNFKGKIISHRDINNFISITQASTLPPFDWKHLNLFITPCYEYEGGAISFIETCKRLDKSINSWLKSKNVEDLNSYLIDASTKDWTYLNEM
jgi:hypothetical protein